jgi:iron complex transport system substrate-binding protein
MICFGYSCKQKQEATQNPIAEKEVELKYSTTFKLFEAEQYKRIVITKPWPKAEKELTYILAKDQKYIPKDMEYDFFVELPIQKIVLTSTTHIPSLISLNQLDKWVGFPGLDYVSSPEARNLIAQNKLSELGKNEALNTEKLLALQPDVVIGFAVEGSNKSLNTVAKSGIPVLYNSDWLDEHPLGKAEWIKFFGMLTDTYDLAETKFNEIEKNYLELKSIAEQASNSPSLLAGAMYKDVWYLPGGKSWQAKFLEDANANYLYADTKENGSLSKSFEAVLDQANNAEFWIAPAQFTSYSEMLESSQHYAEFKAFQEKKIFTIAKTKGEKGGVLYYELAPNRPDLVLRDLVGILHPELLDLETYSFFKPLDD